MAYNSLGKFLARLEKSHQVWKGGRFIKSWDEDINFIDEKELTKSFTSTSIARGIYSEPKGRGVIAYELTFFL